MKIISKTDFNTNNGWGFGGAIGTTTKYDNGISIVVGRNYHRHTGTSSANCVYVEVNEDGFSVKARTRAGKEISTLKGIEKISVLQCEDSYKAIVGDIETFDQWGIKFKKIKTILIKLQANENSNQSADS